MVTQTSHAGLYSNLDIYGRQGRISLHGVGFNYSIDVVSSALPAYSQPTSIHLPQMEDLRILMHQPQLAEFAQAIRERRQPAITVSDGRRVLKVLDAFIRSERVGAARAHLILCLRRRTMKMDERRSEAQLLRIPYHSTATDDSREFLVYLPIGYDTEKDKRWPVIFYLHGGGARRWHERTSTMSCVTVRWPRRGSAIAISRLS